MMSGKRARSVVTVVISFIVLISMALVSANVASAATPTGSVSASTVAHDISAIVGQTNTVQGTTSAANSARPDYGSSAPTNVDGLTVWANVTPGVSYAARSTPNATQQFIHIADNRAPTTFNFNVPDGYTAKANPDGTIQLLDAANHPVSVLGSPWAVDAHNKPVPTSYQVTDNGKSITQTVEHNRSGVVYPVVADPIVIFIVIAGAILLTKCAVSGGWEAGQLKGRKWNVVLWRVLWVCATG